MDRSCDIFQALPSNCATSGCCNHEVEGKRMQDRGMPEKMAPRPNPLGSNFSGNSPGRAAFLPEMNATNARTPPPPQGSSQPVAERSSFTTPPSRLSAPAPPASWSLSISRDEMCRIISRSRLCQSLPRQKLLSVLNLMNHNKVPEGRYVVKQGDKASSLMFVLSGEVSVDVEGRPLAKLCKGDFFGESALCWSVCRAGEGNHQLRSADCRALTDAELVELRADALLPIIHTFPEVHASMLSIINEAGAPAPRLVDLY